MLWFKKRSREIERVEQLSIAIRNSFINVKRDTQNIFAWLNFLYQKTQQQEQTIKDLQLQLKYIPKTPEEIKYIIDRYYNYSELLTRLNELKSRIEEIKSSQLIPTQPQLQAQQPQIQPFNNHMLTKMDNMALRLEKLESKQDTRSYIREKIIKKLTKNSKDFIKDSIYNLIKKYEKISALQLREIIVEEQLLCSKSSFYRILEELEAQEDVETVHDKKEKYYFFKAIKHI